MLRIFQGPGIASPGSLHSRLPDLVVCRVGESQNHLIETLAEFVFLAQEFQRVLLGRCRGLQDKIPLAGERGARDSSVHRRDETYGSRVQVKSCGIALEGEIADAYRFAAQREITQRLV